MQAGDEQFERWWKRRIHESGLNSDQEREVKYYASLAYKAGQRSGAYHQRQRTKLKRFYRG